jgi:hypothetical protein
VNFEWDPPKASQNQLKHGVSFHEAATVFEDPLAMTYNDPDHSISERRFITAGMSEAGRVLIVAHADRAEGIRVMSARKTTRRERNAMKPKNEKQKRGDEPRREYDLSKLQGGIRGKYSARFKAGTNIVLLSPDVAEYFSDDQSVNSALRKLIRLSKSPVRRAP